MFLGRVLVLVRGWGKLRGGETYDVGGPVVYEEGEVMRRLRGLVETSR